MKDSEPKNFRNSSFFKNFLLMTTGGFFLITSLFLIGVWRTGTSFIHTVGAIFNTPASPPQVDVQSLVVNQVRGVSELTTAVFVMDAVVPASQDRKVGDFTIGTTNLLYMGQGEIRAGIDLTALNAQDVKISDNTVQIVLPPPEILDSKIDVNRSQVYHYDRGFLNLGPDVAPQLQTMAERETLNKILLSACDHGVLEDANEKAELAVTQLLTIAGYDNIEVETTQPSADVCRLNSQSMAKSTVSNTL